MTTCLTMVKSYLHFICITDKCIDMFSYNCIFVDFCSAYGVPEC